MEGHGRLGTYAYQGNAFEMMKYVSKTYVPVVDKEISKYPTISNFPSRPGKNLRTAAAGYASGFVAHVEPVQHRRRIIRHRKMDA